MVRTHGCEMYMWYVVGRAKTAWRRPPSLIRSNGGGRSLIGIGGDKHRGPNYGAGRNATKQDLEWHQRQLMNVGTVLRERVLCRCNDVVGVVFLSVWCSLEIDRIPAIR